MKYIISQADSGCVKHYNFAQSKKGVAVFSECGMTLKQEREAR